MKDRPDVHIMVSLAALDMSGRERAAFPGKEVAMVQARTLREKLLSQADTPSYGYALHPSPIAGASASAGMSDIQDLLGSITDRPDLERLFARRVGLDSILKLIGRHVNREQILHLIESPHLEEDLKKLLK